MDEERVLFPFVDGMNVEAIDYALRFSKATQLPLVALALISQPAMRGMRAEHVQQAQDFLETIAARAEMHGLLSIERHESFSQDISKSVLEALIQLHCRGIIFLLQDDVPCFLDLKDVESVRQGTDAKVYLLHLPQQEKKHILRNVKRVFSSFL